MIRYRLALLSALLATFTVAHAAAPLDGTLDPSFGSNGLRWVAFDQNPANPIDVARDVVVDASGRIYLVGTVVDIGANQIGIVRLLANGSTDISYGTNGRVVAPAGGNMSGMHATFDGQGNLLVGGTRQLSGTNTDFAACRFNSAGQLSAFPGNPNSLACVSIPFDIGGNNADTLRSIAVDSQGRILMAGNVGFSASFIQAGVVRLLANGTLDLSFGNNGRHHFLISGQQRHNVNAMLVQPNGKIWLFGDSVATGADNSDGMAARLTATGQLDTTFSGDGFHTYSYMDPARSMSFNTAIFDRGHQGGGDSSVYVAGRNEQIAGSGQYAGAIGRLTPGGSPFGSFGNSGFIAIGAGHDLTLTGLVQRSDLRLVMTGTQTAQLGGTSDFFAMALRADGSTEAGAFNAPHGRISIDFGTQGGQDTAYAAILTDRRLIIAGTTFHAPPADLDFAAAALTVDRIFGNGHQLSN